ncbi:unnamed protein product [Durusdinium trenchii]|uniref:dTMP kinase n=1 Tax=Durusdinium trenchii TaxID=1381693 RepID=A0ABP0JL89_9DINO
MNQNYSLLKEEAERAHRAEIRLDQVVQELRKAQAALSLQSSLSSVEQHCTSLEERWYAAKDQRTASQCHAEEFCKKIQQDIREKLEASGLLPPSHIEARVKEDTQALEHVELPALAREAEEKIYETNSLQTAAIADLRAEQQRQHGCVVNLTEQLEKNRALTLKKVSKISGTAKEKVLENWSSTEKTLQNVNDVFSEMLEATRCTVGSVDSSASSAQQRFAERVASLRQSLAQQRSLLEQSAKKTSEALSAAQSAVTEQHRLSEESMAGALEAVEQLQQMHVEVLMQVKQETSQSADKMQAATSSVSQALDSNRQQTADATEQQQQQWDSVADAFQKHAEAEDAMIQTAKTESERIEQASVERIAGCAERTAEAQGRALGGVQALRKGAATALQKQCTEVNDFIEGSKASILDQELPQRSRIPEIPLPPLPSEEQVLSEFQSSRQPMSAGLIQSVTSALRNAKQSLSPVQLTSIQEAMQLLDLPLEEKPVWGSSATRGLFLVFEGLDRSGKSTQSKKLEEYLSKVGPGPVKWMCFPNRKTPIGSAIDLYLRRQLELPDEAVHRLFSANRWEMAKSIVEDLRAGTTIICDRYAFSGVAYSAAKGLDFSWCQAPDRGLPCPDGVFFLHIDEKVGASRSNFGDERYENADMQATVRTQFKDARLRAQVNWRDVDGARDMEVIHAEIRTAVEAIRQEDQENRQRPIQRLWIK